MVERREITKSLVAIRITHRWTEDLLVVPTAAEQLVESILDEYDNVAVDDE